MAQTKPRAKQVNGLVETLGYDVYPVFATYATKAASTAAFAGIPADAYYIVTEDESVTGSPMTRYRKTGGVAVLNANLDQLRTDLANPAAGFGADLVAFKQAGAGAANRLVSTKLEEFVSVKDFGASAAASNATNTAAVQAAAATGLPFTLSGLTITLTASVTLTNDIIGPGKLLSDSTMLIIGTNGVTVDSVEFESTAVGGTSVPPAVFSMNHSRVTVRNCVLTNCRAMVRNNALTRQTDFRFQNNTVNADFTLIEHITNQNDVVTVRGIDGVWITGNNFTILNVHRVLKIADIEQSITAGTAFRARNVFVTGNRIVGSTDSGKQVMDLFFFTSDIVVAENLIDVSGFSTVVENKTGMTQNYPQNTMIVGNKLSNDGQSIGLQGSYGATTPGYDVGYQNFLISENIIISTAATIGSLKIPIDVRFYRSSQISGNNIITPDIVSGGVGQQAIRVLACGHSMVTGNHISNGFIDFGTAVTNQNGEPFAALQNSIICSHNTVENFGGTSVSGGIVVANIVAAGLRVLIHGNYVKQAVDDAASAGCVAITGTTLNSLSVCENTGTMANAAEQRLRILSSTIGNVLERGNSWNQIGRASTTFDPPSVAAGGVTTTTLTVTGAALATDFVDRVQFSRALAGLIMTAWVSAADTVTVQFSNSTAGAIDLASGTLAVQVGRVTVI